MPSLDLVELLKAELLRGQRPPDGLLHASGDLVGPLRHSQLKLAGAPYKENSIASQIRLETGTMWHNRMHAAIVASGVPFMQEVKLNRWLPEGWGGTADWLFFQSEAFLLRDLKTIKPEGLRWIMDGAKEEHVWQTSVYYHALRNAELPMWDYAEILYLPMGDTNDDQVIEPVLVEVEILAKDLVWGVMEDRWAATQRYLMEMDDGLLTVSQRRSIQQLGEPLTDAEVFVTDLLAPPMAREQKVNWNGKQGVWDVKLVPHWSSMFCPFDNELCDCSEAGVTKIGHYTLDGIYEPRNGYADYAVGVVPSESEVRLRRGASVVPTL